MPACGLLELFQTFPLPRSVQRTSGGVGIPIPETTVAQSLNLSCHSVPSKCLGLIMNTPLHEHTTLPFKVFSFPNFPIMVKGPYLLSCQDPPQFLTTAYLSFLLSTPDYLLFLLFHSSSLGTNIIHSFNLDLLSPR